MLVVVVVFNVIIAVSQNRHFVSVYFSGKQRAHEKYTYNVLRK